MERPTAYYSIFQYCPERFRAESINVGLLVFTQSQRKVRNQIATGLQRLKDVFGLDDADVRRAARSLSAMEHRINTPDFGSLDEWTRFIESRANDVQLTPPRLVNVENTDTDFHRLFNESVEKDLQAPK